MINIAAVLSQNQPTVTQEEDVDVNTIPGNLLTFSTHPTYSLIILKRWIVFMNKKVLLERIIQSFTKSRKRILAVREKFLVITQTLNLDAR